MKTNKIIFTQKDEFIDTGKQNILLIKGDCMIVMKKIKPKTINAIIVDLPYGVSLNKWIHLLI